MIKNLFYKLLDINSSRPFKAHEDDAGLDLYCPTNGVVEPHGNLFIDLKIAINIPKGCVGLIFGRSSISKKGIQVLTGVIDSGFIGSLGITLHNGTDNDFKFNQGERLGQLVILPLVNTKLKEVDAFKQTERGYKGYGSSGK